MKQRVPQTDQPVNLNHTAESILEKEVTEIIYKNSHDCSEGLIINFENIKKVISLLCEAKKQPLPVLRFVKATERTPVYAGKQNSMAPEKVYCCIKANGLYFSAFFNYGKRHFEVNHNTIWTEDQFEKFKTEWLEEETPLPVQSKVEGE